MNSRLMIQVVPRLTPTQCGVSDHAITLANELKSSFGIESAFVVLNSEQQCEVSYRTVYCTPEQLLSSCCVLSGKRESALLTHVSGYGYSSDGAPQALADALTQVHETGRFALGAYFHELYFDYNTPWKKAFWYSHRQRREVRRIAQLCNLVVTNIAQHAMWLQKEKAPDASVSVLPVFSNIGESSELVPWSDRDPALIVFGQRDTRRRAYRQLAHMTPVLQQLGVQEVVDVGADAEVPTAVAGFSVRRMGRMNSPELARLISSTRFGFVRFTPNEMAKSSVMASVCAMGAVPVLSHAFAGEIDGISDGKQIVTPATVGSASLEQCSRAAWNWYQQHDVNAHARVYSNWMGTDKSREVAAG